MFLLERTTVDLGATGRDDAFGVGRLDRDDLLMLALDLVFQGGFERGNTDRWTSVTF